MEVRHFDHPEVEDSFSPEAYREVSQALTDFRFNLKDKSRTASLWFSYLHYVDLLKQFILAERTLNWLLHFQVTYDILNLFAASGHLNYAKKCSTLPATNARH